MAERETIDRLVGQLATNNQVLRALLGEMLNAGLLDKAALQRVFDRASRLLAGAPVAEGIKGEAKASLAAMAGDLDLSL